MSSGVESGCDDERGGFGGEETSEELAPPIIPPVGDRTSSSKESTSSLQNDCSLPELSDRGIAQPLCSNSTKNDAMESMEKEASASLAMLGLQEGLVDLQDGWIETSDDWNEDSFVRHSLEVDDWELDGSLVRRRKKPGQKVGFASHERHLSSQACVRLHLSAPKGNMFSFHFRFTCNVVKPTICESFWKW